MQGCYNLTINLHWEVYFHASKFLFMPVLLCAIALFILLTWFSVLYIRKKNYFKKHILPLQVIVVNALVEDLDTSKIKLSVCAGSDVESPQSFNLFEIARFVDENYRFSNEIYDDYGLLFTKDNTQILNFDKYISNPVLPKDIKDELKLFYNKEFRSSVKPSKPFFKIDLSHEAPVNTENTKEFCEGTGEAFENWATFKESADNLEFVIDQWIKENSGSEHLEA